MSYSLTWLPGVLRDAGLKVALVDGWETRGHGDVGTIQGVICHHTAGARIGNMPSLGIVRDGRPDLSGPLAQLGLGRDGTYYIIAAGKCNHAGPGDCHGITAGNTHLIGIEAENTGGENDFPWPAVQLAAYQHGVAAILKHIRKSADWCLGHKEYALPHGRKTDPTFSMESFRAQVSDILGQGVPPLVPIPAIEPAPPPGVAPRPTLRRGDKGERVEALQKLLGLPQDGDFGAKTEAAVRAQQRELGMVPDGIVGPRTWAALDSMK